MPTPISRRFSTPAGAGKGGDAQGPSFASVLKEAVGSVLETGRKSDAQSVAMASGKANVMDVVTAVAETDVAVSTLVSVRDRVIQSYEDIMKMTHLVLRHCEERSERSNPESISADAVLDCFASLRNDDGVSGKRECKHDRP